MFWFVYIKVQVILHTMLELRLTSINLWQEDRRRLTLTDKVKRNFALMLMKEQR